MVISRRPKKLVISGICSIKSMRVFWKFSKSNFGEMQSLNGSCSFIIDTVPKLALIEWLNEPSLRIRKQSQGAKEKSVNDSSLILLFSVVVVVVVVGVVFVVVILVVAVVRADRALGRNWGCRFEAALFNLVSGAK